MQTILFLSLLLAVWANAASLVLDLNDANFDKLLTAHAPMLVEFYAPWCGHCKALEPEYEAAAQQLKELGGKVTLAKVDATNEDAKELTKRFNIQGFPTLKFFSTSTAGVKPLDFDGERKAGNIVKWCTKRAGPAFTTLESAAAADALAEQKLSEDEIKVLAYFPLKEHIAGFEKQAQQDDNHAYFAYVGTHDKYTVPTVTVLRWFNDSISTSDPAVVSNAAELAKFVETASQPFSHVQVYNAEDVIRAKTSSGVYLIEFYAPWCGYCKEFTPQYEKVALHYQTAGDQQVQVGKLDGTVYEDTLGQEHVDSFPTTKLYKNGASVKYNGELNAKDVIAFVEAKLNAKAEQIEKVDDFIKLADEDELALWLCGPETAQVADLIAFEFTTDKFKVAHTPVCTGVDQPTMAVLYNSKGLVSFTDSVTGDGGFAALRKWVKRQSIPKVFMFDDDIFQQVQEAEFKYLFLAISDKEDVPEHTKKAMAEASDNAQYVDTAFAFADSSADYMLEFFGLKPQDLPAVRVLDVMSADMAAYAGPQGEFSAGDLLATYQKLMAGELTKLEPPAPEEAYAEEDEEEEEEEAEEEEDEEETKDEL